MTDEKETDGILVDTDEIVDVDEYDSAPMTMEEGENGSKTASFVDFAPLPRPPVPPPAKYKLCFIIWVLVYFVSWFAQEAGIIPAFIKGGLNVDGAFFCLFMIEILVMVFCGVELLIGLCRVKIAGTWYGFLPWLLQPRCQWGKKSTNFFMVILASFVAIAEDGFSIFNPPKIPQPPPKIRVFDLVDKEKEVVLRAQHKLNPEKLKEYDQWCKSMIQLMEAQPGFVSAVKEAVDEQTNTHTWRLTFQNVTMLNNCMAHSSWVNLVTGQGQLESMLDAPKVTQILLENPPLNAFADLLTRQGESTPRLPPKKWKVWFTTSASLFFARLIINSTVQRYFIKWGWVDWNEDAFRLVSIGALVLMLNYVTTPATNLLVHDWMVRRPEENEHPTAKIFPWKQLNDGVSPPFKMIGFAAYFIGCGVVWARES